LWRHYLNLSLFSLFLAFSSGVIFLRLI
jgi:hypothetical protein